VGIGSEQTKRLSFAILPAKLKRATVPVTSPSRHRLTWTEAGGPVGAAKGR
jgi:hypothetical protein